EKMSREELITETSKLPMFQSLIVSINMSIKELWTNPLNRRKKNKTTQKAKKVLMLLCEAEQFALDQIKITGTLLNLTILVKAHATSTRYAKFPAYDDPLEFYIDTSPIVQNLDKIIPLTEKCIQDIELLISSRQMGMSETNS
ncbi:MAG: hypothetical protein Q8T08_24990, partial [Ignavibacteria bacterium]|nr:hypothetical protein [Ignavibacteria bacterium]